MWARTVNEVQLYLSVVCVLGAHDGALLMTSHDRELMNRIVGEVVETDGGSLTTYSGNLGLCVAEDSTERPAHATTDMTGAMRSKCFADTRIDGRSMMI